MTLILLVQDVAGALATIGAVQTAGWRKKGREVHCFLQGEVWGISHSTAVHFSLARMGVNMTTL